jgi:hypothetical protein
MPSPHAPYILTTGLAIGLGATLTLALQARDAVGYPAGAVVSTGSNPVVSAGGQLDGTTSDSPLSATADQSLVITDVILSVSNVASSCRAHAIVSLNAGGASLARFAVGVTSDSRSYDNHEPQMIARLSSGIHVPPGSTLVIDNTQQYTSGCSGNLKVEYTLSGYYAQP